MIENYEKVLVTKENIEEIREEISCDQADAIEPGDIISTYAIFYQPGNQRGQLTIIHYTDNTNRLDGIAGICFGADSDWGDWDDENNILTTDEGRKYDITGEDITEEGE